MLKSMNRKIALFLMVLAVLYLVSSFQLPSYPYVPVDSDVVPIGLGVILLGLAVGLFFIKDTEKEEKAGIPRKELFVVLAVVGFIIVYIFLLEILGFLIVTALFIFCCSRYLGYTKILSNAIVSIALPIFIYLLFDSFLQIQLPAGILPI